MTKISDTQAIILSAAAQRETVLQTLRSVDAQSAWL